MGYQPLPFSFTMSHQLFYISSVWLAIWISQFLLIIKIIFLRNAILSSKEAYDMHTLEMQGFLWPSFCGFYFINVHNF
jgi:hypothetical protein